MRKSNRKTVKKPMAKTSEDTLITEGDFPNKARWQGLMRASILSTTTYKLYSYIQLADQKAMALIIMNSIIVPVAMKSLDEHNFMFPATLAIITGVLSIFTAIICIFPKRGRNYKPDGSKNLLHFSDLGALTEKQYLEMMQPVYNDPAALGVEVLKDIHDVSRRVLIPKFRLLKIAYTVFFIGNLSALIAFFANIWT